MDSKTNQELKQSRRLKQEGEAHDIFDDFQEDSNEFERVDLSASDSFEDANEHENGAANDQSK